MKILVKWTGDWSDEFYCQEFKIFDSQDEFDSWIRDIKKLINANEEIYFGTNEALYFHDFNAFASGMLSFTLTDDEAKVLKKFFPESSFGTSGVFDIDLDMYEFDDEDIDNIQDWDD